VAKYDAPSGPSLPETPLEGAAATKIRNYHNALFGTEEGRFRGPPSSHTLTYVSIIPGYIRVLVSEQQPQRYWRILISRDFWQYFNAFSYSLGPGDEGQAGVRGDHAQVEMARNLDVDLESFVVLLQRLLGTGLSVHFAKVVGGSHGWGVVALEGTPQTRANSRMPNACSPIPRPAHFPTSPSKLSRPAHRLYHLPG